MTMITSELCQAARILVKIDREALSQKADVPVAAIEAFEDGVAVPSAEILAALKQALEQFGAVFLPEEDGGAGVKLKFGRSEAKRIAGWEGEGGSTGDDEVL